MTEPTLRERLASIESNQRTMLSAMSSLSIDVRSHIENDSNIFHGNADRPGIITKIDRIEQTDRVRSKSLWLIWGTMLAGVITFLAERFSH